MFGLIFNRILCRINKYICTATHKKKYQVFVSIYYYLGQSWHAVIPDGGQG